MTKERVVPIHEMIVGAIHRCKRDPPLNLNGEIFRIFWMIKKTPITKGHDEIVAAIKKYFDFAGSEKWAHEIREVMVSITRQKKISDHHKLIHKELRDLHELISRALDEEAPEHINLGKLQHKLEKLLKILKKQGH